MSQRESARSGKPDDKLGEIRDCRPVPHVAPLMRAARWVTRAGSRQPRRDAHTKLRAYSPPSQEETMLSGIAIKTYGTVAADRRREMSGLEFVRGLVEGI